MGTSYEVAGEGVFLLAEPRDKTVRKIRCAGQTRAAVWGYLGKGQQRETRHHPGATPGKLPALWSLNQLCSTGECSSSTCVT